jgi:hypothetical protein
MCDAGLMLFAGHSELNLQFDVTNLSDSDWSRVPVQYNVDPTSLVKGLGKSTCGLDRLRINTRINMVHYTTSNKTFLIKNFPTQILQEFSHIITKTMLTKKNLIRFLPKNFLANIL